MERWRKRDAWPWRGQGTIEAGKRDEEVDEEEGAREEDRPLHVEVDEEGESGLGRRTPEA